jgi:hypothetical protein
MAFRATEPKLDRNDEAIESLSCANGLRSNRKKRFSVVGHGDPAVFQSRMIHIFFDDPWAILFLAADTGMGRTMKER